MTQLSTTARLLVLRAALRTVATGEHVYLATGCLHGDHHYCQAGVRGDGQPKRPAQCKFCAAGCVCRCHGGPGVQIRPALTAALRRIRDAVR